MKTKVIGVVILFLMNYCPFVVAEQDNGKLHQIMQQIFGLKEQLQSDKSQQTRLEQQLKNAELAMGQVSVSLTETHQQIATQKKQLQQLQQLQTNYQQQLQVKINELASHVRVVYMFGQQSHLKTILNQQNPESFNRMLTYYHYLLQYQIQLAQQLQQLLNNIHANQQHIEQRMQALMASKQQYSKKNQQLLAQQAKRQQVLQQLNLQMVSNTQKLAKLLADKQQLQHIIVTINQQVAAIPSGAHFIELQGKLARPTNGRIISYFGSSIQNSQLRTQGILIAAPVGSDVYAVAPGQVVFANWLSGFGLLLIVRHDHGYMTVYGQNSTLFKRVGDEIKAGELIATVGQSGGHTRPALYFAIWSNNKPINPLNWFRRRGDG